MMLKSALWYRTQKNFSVIPIKTDGSKKPEVEWTEWEKELPSEQQIRKWWAKWPKANIGIITGKVSGITVMDFDWYKLSPEERVQYEKDFPKVFTPTAFSPRKGEHRYFEYNPELPTKNGVLKALDIKNDGGYVIAPPSENGNGKYQWYERAKISDTTLHSVPKEVLTLIKHSLSFNSISNNSISIYKGALPPRAINLNEGTRDETLFHIANCLVKGGMPEDEIEQLLVFIGDRCNPPYPQKDIQIKIKSALQRSKVSEKSISEEVREFISVTKGNFRVTDVEHWVTGVTNKSNKAILMALHRLVKDEKIEKLTFPGTYRVIDATSESVNIKNVQKGEWIDVALPFGLEEYCKIAAGNLILIGGVTNSGKSAVIFELIRRNMHKRKCFYFSSEMSKETVRGRIEKFKDETDWDFEVVEGWGQNVDCLKPDDFNFIDWVEAKQDTWTIANTLSAIQQKMKKGVAFAAVQKNRNNPDPFGGEQSKSKAALAVMIDPDFPGAVMRVTKAKAFGEINPNGFITKFKIVQGINLIQEQGWIPETEDKYKDFGKGNKGNKW